MADAVAKLRTQQANKRRQIQNHTYDFFLKAATIGRFRSH